MAHTSTNTWLADAFGLTTAQGRETTERVRSLGGDEAVKVVKLAKIGAHTPLTGDVMDLVEGAQRPVRALETP